LNGRTDWRQRGRLHSRHEWMDFISSHARWRKENPSGVSFHRMILVISGLAKASGWTVRVTFSGPAFGASGCFLIKKYPHIVEQKEK
jgi:hypothetical protein